MKKILILFVMACTINVAAQESVLLRMNYKKGDSYLMDLQMSQDMGATMSMDMNIKMNQEIVSVTGENYVSKIKMAQIAMDMSQGGMSMSYDSSKSEEDLDAGGQAMKAQVGPMLQVVITVKGNNLGEVSETTVTPNIPGAQDFAKQSNSVVYPKKAVRVGDTWTMSKSSQGNTMNFVYKVKSIGRELVMLDVSGKVEGMAAGTINGDMKIDRNSGVPLKSNINMTMSVQGQQMVTKMTMSMSKK